MVRFYSPIFILQMFCLYHAYSKGSDQKWYFIILFLPFIGSLFYLYSTFYSHRNVENLAETLKSSFVTNYKIDKLEKQLAFSETVTNKIELAAEHRAVGNYDRAMELYESCLDGIHAEDPDIIAELVRTAYLSEAYSKAVKYGKLIRNEKIFGNSKEKIALAWSYYHLGRNDEAEACFEEMNLQFMNYEQRHEFATYYVQIDEQEKAIYLLDKLLTEIAAMDSYEKRELKSMHRVISKSYSALRR